ncbi:hypothetical protein Leryth_026520 [Lithospermum erythrorhizon]|uniref:Uncharacterized protein n=1 Tax=Lithospermum erythrorhizon TaxID=34254 RepID=A0AAV3PZL8_LITER|nr:hypothetical protein Leryth_026520 [Lithospermum erythrorhizon]
MCTNATRMSHCASETWRWNSPLPYLVGGVSLLLTTIVVALVTLACSFRKNRLNPSSNDIEGGGGEFTMHVDNITIDTDPKVAVIMAGDENPTCLAVPVVQEIFVEDVNLVDVNEMRSED